MFTSAVTSHIIPVSAQPAAGARISFGRGDMLTEDGVLVASYAEEPLLRFAS